MPTCPICRKMIGLSSKPIKSHRGAYAMHLKCKHPEYWRGSLFRTLEYIKLVRK